MSKRKKTKEEENLTVSQSTKRCSSSGGGQQYFDMIPIDLIIQIFSRLMCGKTMGKCRCVSKQWSSILRGPNLNQFFPINPLEPPRFLFTVLDLHKWLYFSSSQPHNPDENSSIVATPHHTSSDTYVSKICRPVHGWVCHQLTGQNFTMAVVFNPITGQTITTPKIYEVIDQTRCYFGYDPVCNQFKVLCITSVLRGAVQHHVLTLETGNLLWRKIRCCIHCFLIRWAFIDPRDIGEDNGICINGVIYYRRNITIREDPIVCFNVRSERFDYIGGREHYSSLINYKGKLGAIDHSDYPDMVLWVLEDAEKQEWSKHVFEIPLQWLELDPFNIYWAGATSKGEIVFHTRFGASDCVYIYYYNLEKKSMVRVRVEIPAGFDFFRCRIYSFANYVEEVKLM